MAVINIQVPITDSFIKELAKEIHTLNVIDSKKEKESDKEELAKPSSEKFYTIKQISKDIGLHKQTLTRHARLGLLVAKKVGKSYQVSQTNLNKYLQSNE